MKENRYRKMAYHYPKEKWTKEGKEKLVGIGRHRSMEANLNTTKGKVLYH